MQDPRIPGSRDPGILGSRVPGIPGGKLTQKELFGSRRIDPSFGAMVLRGSGPQVSRTPISRFPENRFPDGTGARIEFTGKFLDGSVRLDPRYQKLVVNPQNTLRSFFFRGFWGLGGRWPGVCILPWAQVCTLPLYPLCPMYTHCW